MLKGWRAWVWVLVFVAFIVPLPLSVAQAGILPACHPIGPPPATRPPRCTLTHFFELFVNIFNYLLGLIGFVMVLCLIWSGFRFIIYQYGDSPEAELQAAKLTFRRCLWGFVIVVTAFLVLRTVLVVLGVNRDFFGCGNPMPPPICNLFPPAPPPP